MRTCRRWDSPVAQQRCAIRIEGQPHNEPCALTISMIPSRILRRFASARSFSSAATADSQLNMFSEAREAERHVAAGRPDLAEPLLRRAVDICTSLPGAAPLARAARRR